MDAIPTTEFQPDTNGAPTFAIPQVTPADPVAHDVWTYRILTTGLATAFVVLAAGSVVIISLGKQIAPQLWALATTVGGTLIGILVPPPPARATGPTAAAAGGGSVTQTIKRHGVPLALGSAFAASLVAGAVTNDRDVIGLATTTGGALLGYLVPSPVGRTSQRGA